MRWLGLAKAGLQVRLAAMVHNLRRTITLLRTRPHPPENPG
jgi:transposase, IS5 family